MATRYIVSRITSYRNYDAVWTPIGSFDVEADAVAWCDRLRRALSLYIATKTLDGAYILDDQETRTATAYAALLRLDPDAPDWAVWYAVQAATDFVAPTEAEPANALEEWYWAASA